MDSLERVRYASFGELILSTVQEGISVSVLIVLMGQLILALDILPTIY